MQLDPQQQVFYLLGVSLAIGLLIGLERGWKEREVREGERIAGVRTYGLIGLLGGVVGLMAERFGALILGLAFIGMTGVLTVAYVVNWQREQDAGITSLVAGLLTFGFGAMATLGEVAAAAAFAVLTTLLLGVKPLLHRWVRVLEDREFAAGLKLLLISVVLLPVLPDRTYDPWQVLNPYEIWWMVVLIASISFVGYFAIKIAGAGRGAIFTGLFAGLASSTALTLQFARDANQQPRLTPVLATGILLACGTMFPRMVLVAGLINAELVRPLLLPAVIMAAVVYGSALLVYRRRHQTKPPQPGETGLRNPLELRTALAFGLLLALIMLLGELLKRWLGNTGVVMLAAASGVADVDAITLSLAKMSAHQLLPGIAVLGIVIAASVNSLVKGGMALTLGNRQLGLQVGLPLLLAAGCGLLAVWLSVFPAA
jgi:uncharacterized membrane protein (DUF4010 family)